MEHPKQQFTCPMHPQIIKDEPGDCPLCGMHLVPLKEAVNNGEPDAIAPAMDHSRMKMNENKVASSEEDHTADMPKKDKQQYTCSMHRQVIKDEPGKYRA